MAKVCEESKKFRRITVLSAVIATLLWWSSLVVSYVLKDFGSSLIIGLLATVAMVVSLSSSRLEGVRFGLPGGRV